MPILSGVRWWTKSTRLRHWLGLVMLVSFSALILLVVQQNGHTKPVTLTPKGSLLGQVKEEN